MAKDVDAKAIRLADYTPPAFTTVAVDLVFDIHEGQTKVSNKISVEPTAVYQPGADLVLDGIGLELIKISVDGQALTSNQYQQAEETLTLFALPGACEVEITTIIKPEENTALEGLYKSGGMYCTQCEAQGFRKITYYQDRPDVLAKFTTQVRADAQNYPVLLSNGNKISDVDIGAGRRGVTWEDPFPKPSYLFALVAGDLKKITDRFVTMSGREVTLEIFTEPHNVTQCDYAMDALKRSMRWDEEVFGREYDLDIFMIVAVDDFNMGAMENKGLNVFNTSCVLATPDTATDAAYQRVEAVVAHEYFHNWSGNRVTCRDWFQLSLKEGFTVFRDAQFSADMNSRTVKRIEDVTFLRSVQFAEDAGPMAHPIRPDSYIEISNFYTTTIYEKGAEVVRMLHTLCGEQGFRRGSDLYFDTHDGSAATTEDFVLAMEQANKLDLSLFRNWYSQAGTPIVAVTTDFKNTAGQSEFMLTLSQSCPDTPGQTNKAPFHIPVVIGFFDSEGRSLDVGELAITSAAKLEVDSATNSLLVHLTEKQVSVTLQDIKDAPVVSFLRGFSAPIRVEYPRPDAHLQLLVINDSDGFNRWDALQTLITNALSIAMTDNPQTNANQALVSLFGALIQQAMQAADPENRLLLGAMLSLPSIAYVFEQQSKIDVDAIDTALAHVREQIATAHMESWRALYDHYNRADAYSPSSANIACRTLKNVALSYLSVALGGEALEQLLDEQMSAATNLTDRRAALWQAVSTKSVSAEFRQHLLENFYRDNKDEALVVNLWFQLQASSDLASATDIVALSNHEAFDVGNPNKLRSLYGAFAQANVRGFHSLQGDGYELLANTVIELDASNPQIASRLLGPLTRWRRFTQPRGQLMRTALEKVANSPSLSKDVYEVASKSLD